MYNKQPKDKFSAISVSLDDPKDEAARRNVLKFLHDQKATFTNVILDEKAEDWQEKLNFDGPPCVFVFNPDGKVAKQFKDEFTYDAVKKQVDELLSKK
jgi:hypothetical protein